jgi:hypothetical protein
VTGRRLLKAGSRPKLAGKHWAHEELCQRTPRSIASRRWLRKALPMRALGEQRGCERSGNDRDVLVALYVWTVVRMNRTLAALSVDISGELAPDGFRWPDRGSRRSWSRRS